MPTLLKILIAIAVLGGLMGIGLWIDATWQTTPAFRWPTATTNRLPVVYSPAYNLGLFGIERLHPFDTRKYEGVFNRLREARWLDGSNHYEAAPLPPDVLLRFYDAAFLKRLSDPHEAARISEIAPLALLPRPLIERHLLRAFRFQTGGTAMAAELAVAQGWAINLGGGFHHAGLTQAGGFCFLADLTLAVRLVRERHADIRKIMIIDLDAHQGDGHERDLGDDPEIFTVDLYGGDNYPWAHDLKSKIEIDRPLPALVRDAVYLKVLDEALDEAFRRFHPDLVFYVAGSDVLASDPLGQLDISADGVILRDEKVFAKTCAAGSVPQISATAPLMGDQLYRRTSRSRSGLALALVKPRVESSHVHAVNSSLFAAHPATWAHRRRILLSIARYPALRSLACLGDRCSLHLRKTRVPRRSPSALPPPSSRHAPSVS